MNTAWTAASEELYKASQQGGANGGGQPDGQQAHEGHAEHANAGAEDTVTDAEFEEVK
jgi:molecular chaperone DnaK